MFLRRKSNGVHGYWNSQGTGSCFWGHWGVTEVSLSDDAVRMCDVRGKDKAGCIKYRAVGPEQQKPDRVDKMQDQGTGQYHEENEASGDPVFGGQHWKKFKWYFKKL